MNKVWLFLLIFFGCAMFNVNNAPMAGLWAQDDDDEYEYIYVDEDEAAEEVEYVEEAAPVKKAKKKKRPATKRSSSSQLNGKNFLVGVDLNVGSLLAAGSGGAVSYPGLLKVGYLLDNGFKMGLGLGFVKVKTDLAPAPATSVSTLILQLNGRYLIPVNNKTAMTVGGAFEYYSYTPAAGSATTALSLAVLFGAEHFISPTMSVNGDVGLGYFKYGEVISGFGTTAVLGFNWYLF